MTILDLLRNVFKRDRIGGLIVVLLMVGVGVFIVSDTEQHVGLMETLRQRGIRADGSVIVKTDNTESKTTVYRLEGFYFLDGTLDSQDYALEVDHATYDRISTGDSLGLVYDPQNPVDVALQADVDSWDVSAYRKMRLNGIVVFYAVAAAISLFVWLGRRRRARP